jgi:hypothetical protein
VPSPLRGLHGWRKKRPVRILPTFVASRIRVGGGLANWAFLVIRFRSSLVIIFIIIVISLSPCN